MKTTEMVLEYFAERGGLPGSSQEEKLACAYLDAKIIDSMGIIDLVTYFEDKLDIRFEAEDLQSEEFQTVGGLSEVIDRLRTSIP